MLAKKVQPEPSIQERIEAAIGVCQFTKYVEEYDPKIGIYLVGETLSDLFGEYKQGLRQHSRQGQRTQADLRGLEDSDASGWNAR